MFWQRKEAHPQVMEIWKYVDDATIAKLVAKKEPSYQDSLNDLVAKSDENYKKVITTKKNYKNLSTTKK